MIHRITARRVTLYAVVCALLLAGLAAAAATASERPIATVATSVVPVASGPMSVYEEVEPPPGPECVCIGYIRVCYPIWDCDASGCRKIQYCQLECIEWICYA